jgi:hypothetical protein
MRSTNTLYTGADYHLRLGIFLSNSRFVRSHNAHSRFRTSLNRFAALTPAEYRCMLGLLPRPLTVAAPSKRSPPKDFPSYDWRDQGAVTEVKNQGTCGSCWAFAAISSAESSNKIIGGTLYLLSEQNLIDCVTTCYGCNGGLATLAYDYVLQYQHGQFVLSDAYPYTGSIGDCKFNADVAIGQIYGYLAVVSDSEPDLAAAVAGYGPAAAAVDASTVAFQLYGGGIFEDEHCSSIDLNHGIGIVGFGVEDDVGFWIVKNSWGTDWGEEGYIRIVRGRNECGIASFAHIASSTQ